MKRINIMKKVLPATLCIVLSIALLSGCTTVLFSSPGGRGVSGSGSKEAFTINVGEITEIDVALLCNIVLNTAPSNTVTFEVQSNLKEYITIEEIDGVLKVRTTRNLNITGGANTPVLTVSSAALNKVTHAGAGRITANDPITADDFTLNIAGAAEGNLGLNVQNLTVSLSGAGNFELSGTADNAHINMSGAGRVDALGLSTRVASANLSGAGTVRISCSDELTVSASGVGTVEYRGSPTVDLARSSGLTTVRQVD